MQKDRQMPGMVCVVVFLRFRDVNASTWFTNVKRSVIIFV